MNTSTYNEKDNDSENDDANDTNASKPLLLQSSTPTSQEANRSTITIKVPILAYQNKSTSEKKTKNNNGENRALSKLGHLVNIQLNRIEHCRPHRDKRNRINIGLFAISFLSVIYLCVSLNLSVDKPSPQIIVDVPPIDTSLAGSIVPADGLHPNVILFISTKPPGLQPANGVSFQSNMSNRFPRIHSNTSSSSSPSTLTLPSSSTLLPEIVSSSPVNQSVKDGFLVWSPGCQIPAMDPLAKDVMKLFRREKYESCSKSESITRIEMNWTNSEATLIYNYKPKWYSAFVESTCCYSEITRTGSGKHADEQFKLSSCTKFTESIKLPATIEFLFVKCESLGKIVYKSTHAVIRERPAIRERLNEFKKRREQQRPLSVLMLSIDSISRLNLIRAMPKTAQHLYDTGWFELQGYNKIDDNTFPNLMAILTGFNSSLAYGVCKPVEIGKLDKCPFIWADFRNSGYVTSYGEDESSISSFNYNKKGFLKPPTDYYLRPYMLAAEKHLPIKRKHSLKFCLGNKHSADHVYDYAMDFATHYKNDASFGLYWTNTFSHNDISDPSSMDTKMNDYLKNLESRGILNESMVVFFSDHGIRFGPVRHLITGWFEERLPFIFIWLPEWFRNEHPEIVHALKINRNRLTNPYDLHMTLKHVLQLANPDQVYAPPTSCPNCQSLFTEVPWNRSCEEVSIAAHWCTCALFQPHDKNDVVVKNALKFVLDGINHSLKNFTHDDHKHPLCAELKLKRISDVRKAEYRDGNDPYDDYLLKFDVSPSDGWFESTVRFRKGIGFELTGTVSRLDSYGSQGHCMKIDYMRKYCYCTGSSNPKNRRG